MATSEALKMAEWLRWRVESMGSRNAAFIPVPRDVVLEIAQMLEDLSAG